MPSFCPYKALGLTRGDSVRRIERAFEKLKRPFHPDKNGHVCADGGEKYKEITLSYRFLISSGTRACFESLPTDADKKEIAAAWKKAELVYAANVKKELKRTREEDNASADRTAEDKKQLEELVKIRTAMEDINQADLDIRTAKKAVKDSKQNLDDLPKLCSVLQLAEELKELLLPINLTKEDFAFPNHADSPAVKKMRKAESLLAKCWENLDRIDVAAVKHNYHEAREKFNLAQTQISSARESLQSLSEPHTSGEAMLDGFIDAKGEILDEVVFMKQVHDKIIFLKRYLIKKVKSCELILRKLTDYELTQEQELLKAAQAVHVALEQKNDRLKARNAQLKVKLNDLQGLLAAEREERLISEVTKEQVKKIAKEQAIEAANFSEVQQTVEFLVTSVSEEGYTVKHANLSEPPAPQQNEDLVNHEVHFGTDPAVIEGEIGDVTGHEAVKVHIDAETPNRMDLEGGFETAVDENGGIPMELGVPLTKMVSVEFDRIEEEKGTEEEYMDTTAPAGDLVGNNMHTDDGGMIRDYMPTGSGTTGLNENAQQVGINTTAQDQIGLLTEHKMGVCKLFGPQFAVKVELSNGCVTTVTPMAMGKSKFNGMGIWNTYRPPSAVLKMGAQREGVAAVTLTNLNVLSNSGAERMISIKPLAAVKMEFPLTGATAAVPIKLGANGSMDVGFAGGPPLLAIKAEAPEAGTSKSQSKKYFCDICGIGYSHACSLSRHKDSKHTAEEKGDLRKYICPGCGKSFDREDSCLRHYRQFHAKELQQ